MNVDDSSLFELLDPPRGGVEKLRRRLAEGDAPLPAYRLSAFSLAAVGLLLAALYYLPGQRQPDAAVPQAMIDAPEFDRLLGREPQVLLPIRVEIDEQPVEAQPVESTDPQVRIYQLL